MLFLELKIDMICFTAFLKLIILVSWRRYKATKIPVILHSAHHLYKILILKNYIFILLQHKLYFIFKYQNLVKRGDECRFNNNAINR